MTTNEPVNLQTRRTAQVAEKGEAAPPGRKNIQKRILHASKAVPILRKDDTNPDEGWSFVSIDTYYEIAAKALRDAGASWVATEERCAMVEGSDVFLWTFRFDVFDEDGNIWPCAARVTIPHQLEGPQTAGKVVSYAEKVFLRMLMKLVTGEPDADKSSPRPAIKARSAPADQITFSYEGIIDQIGKVKDLPALDLLMNTRKKDILNARANDPDIYANIAAARTKKLKELEQ